MSPISETSTIGTMSPCTSRIQLPAYAAPGYARNVTELMSVAKIDIPIAQSGTRPEAVKYAFESFCL